MILVVSSIYKVCDERIHFFFCIIFGNYNFFWRLLVIYRSELNSIRWEKENQNHRFIKDGEQTC